MSFNRDCPAKCPGCKNDIDSPAKLPRCSHILCDVCAIDLIMCPVDDCGKKIPKNVKFGPDADRDQIG